MHDDRAGLGRKFASVLVHIDQIRVELDDGAGPDLIDAQIGIVHHIRADRGVVELDRVARDAADVDGRVEHDDPERALADAVGEELHIALVFGQGHGRRADHPEVLRTGPRLDVRRLDEVPEVGILEDLQARREVFAVFARHEHELVEHVAKRLIAPRIIDLGQPPVLRIGKGEPRARLAPVHLARPANLVDQLERAAAVERDHIDAPELDRTVGIDGPEIDAVAVLLVHRRRIDLEVGAIDVALDLAIGNGVLGHMLADVELAAFLILAGLAHALAHHDRPIGRREELQVEAGDSLRGIRRRRGGVLPRRAGRHSGNQPGALVQGW